MPKPDTTNYPEDVYGPLGSSQRKKNIVRCNELRRQFGISLVGYRLLSEAQGNVCAVCKEPETTTQQGVLVGLAVDHDHETGAIRQLLCRKCNTGIGLLRDNPDLLEEAALYIRRHGG